jgi:3-oxoadipate enol-lactonase
VPYLELPWGRCHYQQVGSGRALILIHGWSYTLRTWDDVVPLLVDAGFDVVAYDIRGHGESGWDGQAVTMRELAADVRAVVDHLGVTSPVLCGHSLGGMIALEYAVAHPVAGLVLAGTGVERRPVDAELAKVLLDQDAAGWWPIFEQALYSPAYRLTAGHRLEAARGRFLAADLPALQAVINAVVTRDDLTPRLSELTAPTTVVVGENDQIWPADTHADLADRIPGAELVVIPGAGHLLPEETPGELAEVLVRRPSVGSQSSTTPR